MISHDAPQWTVLEELLSSAMPQQAAVHQTYPQSRYESYFQSLAHLNPKLADEVKKSGRRFVTAGRLAQCPLLAVAGKLNAGKTSLVSSFLSPAGRLRTLRGQANHQGTHRFALWLPERWRADPELWGILCARIGEAIGAPPEELSLDASEAHAQYNNRDGDAGQLSIPLIATDPALDELGIGFLDCPDTDTSEALGMGSPEERLDLLRRAAPLCSGFLVVAAHNALRDVRLEHVLRTLSEAMPHVQRLLAINLVRPRYAPDEVLSDNRDLLQRHTIRECYLAYDFDIPESKKYRPASAGGEPDEFPAFFIPTAQPSENIADAVPTDRWLRSLPNRLDPGEMFRQLATDLRGDVQRTTQAGVTFLQEISQERTQQAARVREQILQAGLQFFVAKWDPQGAASELRLLHSSTITNQLIQAFTNTAPWYAWLPLKLKQGVQSLSAPVVSTYQGLVRWLSGGAAKEAAENVKNRLRAGRAGRLVTVESLKDVLQDAGLQPWWEQLKLTPADQDRRCLEVIERLEHESNNLLDQKALEQAAQEVWQNVPPGRKFLGGLTVLGTAIVAFGAVLLIPFDGGTAVLAAASVKELLGAAGLSTAGAWWSGTQFQSAVSGATAVRQLADFVAALCDAFEVPRQAEDLPKLTFRLSTGACWLPTSSLPRREHSGEQFSFFKVQQEFLAAWDRWSGRTATGWFRR